MNKSQKIRFKPHCISILALGMALCSGVMYGQQYPISTGGIINTCAGVLEDSGGPSGTYGDNENFTITICPDQLGDGINLSWVVWNLDPTGPNNNLDELSFWDGDNTSSTSLGSYNTPPQGGVVQATSFNASGCITVRFRSNGSGVGNFAATITCFTPCDRPTAVATMSEPGPALVCVGETVNFDGTGSFAALGFDILDYEWNFDDGTTATGNIASHSFSEPGEYVVQLNLLDDNDCVNSNVVDLQILVSTTPSFAGTVEDVETCLGATVDLTGVITPVTWTGIPETNFGSGVYLPDSLGVPFNSTVSYTQFDPGQVINSVSEILSVCVSMEHSYMGDLVLSLTCPNGQQIVFHQQGGGGTFLGDANDTDSNEDPVPGECWEYCWSPTATQGTWEANSDFGTSPNVMPSSQGTALIPGTYNSVQPFSNLVGCPLNGTWTYTSLDLWGADNGFLCDWSINFDPSIIPDATQFTPTVGTSTLDSASWSGPNLVIDPTDPLTATATPTNPGTYAYQLFVTDNFGCIYDTTITIDIGPQLEISAGQDVVLCSDPLPMGGVVVANGPPSNCVYTLQLHESFGDTWNGNASLAVDIDGVITNYSINASQVYELEVLLNVQTGSTITLTYTAGTSFNNENSFTLLDDAGTIIYDSPNGPQTGVSYTGTIVCGGGTSPVTWIWSPTDGLTDPTDPLTNVYVTEPTMFYLTGYLNANPDCAVMDSVLVSPDPSIDAGLNAAITLCYGEPAIQLTDSLEGTPDQTGVWTDANNNVVPTTFDATIGAPGTYTYTVTSGAGCIATSALDITILQPDDPLCCGIPDAGDPMYSCNLSINLNAKPGNTGVGVWTGPAGAVFGNASSPQTTVTLQPGMGGTHWFYWRENDGAFCNTVDSVQMILTDPLAITFTKTDAICYSYCDGTAQANVVGGNAAVALEYAWSTGENGSALTDISDLCAGTHTLLVTDDNACTDTASFTITEPILLEIDSIASQPVTCSGDCDGQIEIYDPQAVEYSYNDGLSWTVDPIAIGICEDIHPLRIRDAAGCYGDGVITVTGPPPVVSEFEWGPIPANINAPSITFHNTSTDAQSYVWDVAGMLTTTNTDTEFTFTDKVPGTYNVCLVAINYNDCRDSTCHDVVIDDILFTYVPNAFTPDNDGKNDVFGMSVNIDVITNFEMMIFDRWGQIIYTASNPGDPWFGSFKNSGDILPQGVYAYRILYEIAGTDVQKEMLGHVTLIK